MRLQRYRTPKLYPMVDFEYNENITISELKARLRVLLPNAQNIVIEMVRGGPGTIYTLHKMQPTKLNDATKLGSIYKDASDFTWISLFYRDT
jgi:hypothetical protein